VGKIKPGMGPTEDNDQFTEGQAVIHPVWSICSLPNDVRGPFD